MAEHCVLNSPCAIATHYYKPVILQGELLLLLAVMYVCILLFCIYFIFVLNYLDNCLCSPLPQKIIV